MWYIAVGCILDYSRIVDSLLVCFNYVWLQLVGLVFLLKRAGWLCGYISILLDVA